LGRENVKDIQKTNKFVIVWGENLKLRGEIPPPKGSEKNTAHYTTYIEVYRIHTTV